MALLNGPRGAREVLAQTGGVIIHDSGEVETVGPIDGVMYASGQPEACEAS